MVGGWPALGLQGPSGAASMLTEAELEQWDRTGAVTVRTPLSEPLLQAARAAMLRQMPRRAASEEGAPTGRATNTNQVTEQEGSLIDVVQHPWFEAVAQQCLRAEHAYYNGSALAVSYPDDPGGERAPLSSGYSDGRAQRFPGEHVDVQCASHRCPLCCSPLCLTETCKQS